MFYNDESENQKKKINIIRTVQRLEKELDDYLNKLEGNIEKKLEKRLEKVTKDDIVDKKRQEHLIKATEAWEHFAIEVDKKVIEQNQLKATQIYAKAQLKKVIDPPWMSTTDSAIVTVNNLGHDNATGWRSLAKAQLQQSLLETEDDPRGGDSRIIIRSIIFGINTFTSNELVRKLKDIRIEYYRNANGSDFDEKTELLNSVRPLIKTKIQVPLPKDDWSLELQSMDMTRRSAANNSDHTLDSLTAEPSTICTTSLIDEFKSNIYPGMPINQSQPLVTGTLLTTSMSQSQCLMAMRSAAIEGNFQLAYNLFYKAYDKSTKAKKKSNRRDTNLPTPSKGPPKNLEPFKTLLTAFKNSEEMLFQYAYLVISMIEDYNMNPDASVYNIIMRACEKDSRWRRCIALFRDMKNIHKLIPNALSYEIIIDCCRHSLESPAIIFETLRLQNMPREFCYKAAVCNAGNRISSQVLHETLYSLEKFNTADANAYVYKAHNYDDNSTIETSQSIDDISVLSFPKLPKFNTNKQESSVLTNNNNDDSIKTLRNSIILNEKTSMLQWKSFNDKLKKTLPNSSPTKNKIPGEFNQQIGLQLSRIYGNKTKKIKNQISLSKQDYGENSSWITNDSISEFDGQFNSHTNITNLTSLTVNDPLSIIDHSSSLSQRQTISKAQTGNIKDPKLIDSQLNPSVDQTISKAKPQQGGEFKITIPPLISPPPSKLQSNSEDISRNQSPSASKVNDDSLAKSSKSPTETAQTISKAKPGYVQPSELLLPKSQAQTILQVQPGGKQESKLASPIGSVKTLENQYSPELSTSSSNNIAKWLQTSNKRLSHSSQASIDSSRRVAIDSSISLLSAAQPIQRTLRNDFSRVRSSGGLGIQLGSISKPDSSSINKIKNIMLKEENKRHRERIIQRSLGNIPLAISNTNLEAYNKESSSLK